ncbi:MAG: hypothetical protein HQK60_03160 [Deltaproteobacteria bacterium]|nr:hypothetical protein [Deltaproteobacteria bacterium]
MTKDTFSRKSIEAFSNCSACHPNASQGIYSEHQVSIPGD